MSNTNSKGLGQRLDQVEKNQREMVDGINQLFNDQAKRLSSQDELLGAVIAEIGPDRVVARIEGARKVAEENRVSQEKMELDSGVAAGYLEVVEAVGEDCFITGKELTADGKTIGVGWQVMSYAKLPTAFQELFLGQVNGATVKLDTGSFEIQGVYRLDPVKRSEYKQAQKQAQLEAQLANQTTEVSAGPPPEAPAESETTQEAQ